MRPRGTPPVQLASNPVQCSHTQAMDLKKQHAASAPGAPRGIGPSNHQKWSVAMPTNNLAPPCAAGKTLETDFLTIPRAAAKITSAWSAHSSMGWPIPGSPDERLELRRRSHNGGREPLPWRSPHKTAVVAPQRRALQKVPQLL